MFDESVSSAKNGEYSFVTKAAEPSVKEGKYNKALMVKLESKTPDAQIFYTVDGTNPKDSGILYTGEFEIDKTCTLKTVSIRKNYTTGEIAEYKYEINKLGIILTIVMWIVLAAVVVAVVIMVRKKSRQRKKNNDIQNGVL